MTKMALSYSSTEPSIAKPIHNDEDQSRLNHPFTFVKKPFFTAVEPSASGSGVVTGTVTGRL